MTIVIVLVTNVTLFAEVRGQKAGNLGGATSRESACHVLISHDYGCPWFVILVFLTVPVCIVL